MPVCHRIRRWQVGLAVALGCSLASVAADNPPDPVAAGSVLTNVAAVRNLKPEEAARRLPVRLQGVVTFVFDRRSCFIQDQTAGIFVGNGAHFPALIPGDVVLIEGESGPGEYAPVVQLSEAQVVGRTNLPPAQRVSYEDLATGREDSQRVEVTGLVRAGAGSQCSRPAQSNRTWPNWWAAGCECKVFAAPGSTNNGNSSGSGCWCRVWKTSWWRHRRQPRWKKRRVRSAAC